MKHRLAFAIHDLNSWGGQDRSTLEVARRLSHRWPVDVYAYTLSDDQGMGSWGDVKFHRVAPLIRRPALAKFSYYYAATLPPLAYHRDALVHATGACSLVSDVVQLQFIQAAWKDRLRELGGFQRTGFLKRAYQSGLLEYNIAFEKLVFKSSKTYIAIARGVADELKKYFGIEERVHVVHHGVDSGEFRPESGSDPGERNRVRSELGIERSEVAVLLVGTYERKGLASAIEAVAALPAGVRARLKLVAVGPGDARPFRELAQKHRVADRLIFVGHQKAIIPYYRACDVFLLPTLYEPFGLVVLEAMASGLAPVVSRRAGAAELIVPGQSGLLIDNPLDGAEIARHLERLVGDEALRRSMAGEARAVAVQRGWNRVADEYEAILSPLMAAHG